MDYRSFLVVFCTIIFLPSFVFSLVLHRRGKKPAGIKLFIVSMVLLIALFATEVTIYFRNDKYVVHNPWLIVVDDGLDTSDPDLSFTRKPNINWTGYSHGDLAIRNFDRDPYAKKVLYQTDQEGFHNATEMKNPDIVVIGDSYTEAGNVNIEQGYVQKLADKTGLSTKNLGVAGYTTPEESIIFHKYGEKLKPDILVVQVSESNDIYEANDYYGWVKAGKPKRELVPLVETQKDAWRASSPTYSLYQRVFPLQLNPFPYEAFQEDKEGKKYLTRFFQMPNQYMTPKSNIGWQVMMGSLMRISVTCKESGIRMVVILIPDKIHVLGDLVDFKPESKERYDSAMHLKHEDKLSVYLEGLSRELKYEFIDMTYPLTNSARNGNIVYLPMDTHLSPLGHEVVASELAKVIR